MYGEYSGLVTITRLDLFSSCDRVLASFLYPVPQLVHSVAGKWIKYLSMYMAIFDRNANTRTTTMVFRNNFCFGRFVQSQTSASATNMGGSGKIANMRLVCGASLVMLAATGEMRSHHNKSLELRVKSLELSTIKKIRRKMPR